MKPPKAATEELANALVYWRAVHTETAGPRPFLAWQRVLADARLMQAMDKLLPATQPQP